MAQASSRLKKGLADALNWLNETREHPNALREEDVYRVYRMTYLMRWD